jgi:1-deoxy-D-xylulose-5-phosphate synthase
MIVVLNDNGQVSLPTGTPTAGGRRPAFHLHFQPARVRFLQDFRDFAKNFNKLFRSNSGPGTSIDEHAPWNVCLVVRFLKNWALLRWSVDGHDLENLIPHSGKNSATVL